LRANDADAKQTTPFSSNQTEYIVDAMTRPTLGVTQKATQPDGAW
jgi:hypothetical protein